MTEEIYDGNKLIAEFLGMLLDDTNHFKIPVEFPIIIYSVKGGNRIPTEWLKFYTDWNWLMPVIEKIESIYDEFHGYFGVHITSNSCTIQGTKLRLDKDNPHYAYFADWYANTKIEATYIAVVNWIKWWNQKQKDEITIS